MTQKMTPTSHPKWSKKAQKNASKNTTRKCPKKAPKFNKKWEGGGPTNQLLHHWKHKNDHGAYTRALKLTFRVSSIIFRLKNENVEKIPPRLHETTKMEPKGGPNEPFFVSPNSFREPFGARDAPGML